MEIKLQRYKVLFVCTGNICRSPLAHGVFQHLVDQEGIGLQFRLESAGTDSYHVGDQMDPRMRKTALDHGISFNHQARRVSDQDLQDYDVIFAMDLGHYRKLRSMAKLPDQIHKIKMFREFDPLGSSQDEVPDPYYGGPEGFEQVYQIIHRTSKAILEAFQNYELP